nr:hypothetical protein GCM10020092_056800 [Actinoplanes digitatis]
MTPAAPSPRLAKLNAGGTAPAGYLGDVVERVMPSVLAARAKGLTDINQFVDEHIRRTVAGLVGRSLLLATEVSAEPVCGRRPLLPAGRGNRTSRGAARAASVNSAGRSARRPLRYHPIKRSSIL